jgi:Tfp pilus assembly protein PilF
MQSTEADPNAVGVFIKLAKTHEKVREFEEAISFLKKALRREPRNF